jgi:DNA-binding MurR/RpiR family transcriptional regulator
LRRTAGADIFFIVVDDLEHYFHNRGEVASAPDGFGLLVRARAARPSLPPAEGRVADGVLRDPGAAAGLTVTELAALAGVSEATVLRFCRSLGLAGYAQLRLALAAEAARYEAAGESSGVGSDISEVDPIARVVEKISFADARAIQETAQHLDLDALERVVDAVATARRIDLYGAAASGFVALDLQQKLHRIGLTAFAWTDPHIALTSAALLAPADVAIGISHTGTTVDTIEPLQEARSHGALTVAVTNFPGSPIGDAADVLLVTAARETKFRSGAMASRLVQLMVVDCLFVCVAQRTYGEARKALERTYEAVRHRHRPEPS